MIFAIQAQDLDRYVGLLYPHLLKFEQETELTTVSDILRKLSRKERQLWAHEVGGEIVGIAITEVYETRRGRVMCIWAAAGNASDFEMLMDSYGELEKWAKQIGCSFLEVRGRKGWKKLLPGFKETGVLLEKSIHV